MKTNRTKETVRDAMKRKLDVFPQYSEEQIDTFNKIYKAIIERIKTGDNNATKEK